MSEPNYLARKLRHGAPLSEADIARLEEITVGTTFHPALSDIVSVGDRPDHVHFIVSGMACRYKILPDGRRSIIALLLPGDFCDLHVAILRRMDHSIAALVDCQVSMMDAAELNRMLAEYPVINRACWWATLVDEAVLREWLVNVGRRTADRQLAHLFCEIHVRLGVVGLTQDNTFRMPYTQEALGDMLGITAVHVQRVMRELRDAGLIRLNDRILTLPDPDALAAFADFDPSYLHLETLSQDELRGRMSIGAM